MYYICLVQFPEHGFYHLEDRVLLFYHNVNDPNVLSLINGITTTAEDIKNNSLVELVLTGGLRIKGITLQFEPRYYGEHNVVSLLLEARLVLF